MYVCMNGETVKVMMISRHIGKIGGSEVERHMEPKRKRTHGARRKKERTEERKRNGGRKERKGIKICKRKITESSP